MIILDTDIVTLLSYGKNERLRQRLEEVEVEETIALTIITRMEILQGRFESLQKAANGTDLRTATQRFQVALELLNRFALLYPDDTSCQHFEAILQQRRKRRMGRSDMLIASIALAHKALLVTRNTKDYQGINGLHIENWAD